MGRPEKPINWELVDRLLEAGANQGQIAAAIGVDSDTLHDRFVKQYGCSYTVYSGQKCQYGEALILGAQMKKALNGNAQMLTWLGKVRLKQQESAILQPLNDHSNEQAHEIMLLKNELAKKNEIQRDIPQTE